MRASTLEPLHSLFDKAVNGKKKPQRQELAAEFAGEAAKVGVSLAVSQLKLNDMLAKVFSEQGKKAAPKREAACYIVSEVAQINPSAPLLLLPSLPACFDMIGDKKKPTAQAAQAACDLIFKALSRYTTAYAMPFMLSNIESFKGNAARFKRISDMSLAAKEQVATLLATAIPATTPHLNSLSDDVCESSKEALTNLALTCPNPDMEPFVKDLVKGMVDVEAIPEMVFSIASTTFVAEVMAASLSMMVPILREGLKVKSDNTTKRSCSRIIENMCKLVDEPRYLETFLPKIGPLLKQCYENVSDPEVRNVCTVAHELLMKKASQASTNATERFTEKTALDLLQKGFPAQAGMSHFDTVFQILASSASLLNECNDLTEKVWVSAMVPIAVELMNVPEKDAVALFSSMCEVAQKSHVVVFEEEVEEDAEVLCDLPFGLAYGNKVLLRKTHLKLYRGHKYGIVGQNDCGKTSLLNALAGYKIEGFPSADELRTVFVATDIITELADLSVIDYMYNDPLLRELNIEKSAMEKMLNSVGFVEGAPATTTQTVGTLSGGWRMKLALSRAILLNADILLLDEPTNHLDAYNLKWLETYLLSLTNTTCVMVSHDAGLLTRVANQMIEIDELKLNYYRGNIEAFLEKKPEAKCFFELAKTGSIDFTFPKPGILAGVKSKGKAIMKMSNITFTYPTAKKAQLNNVTISLCLASRVACVGENGAGKSTMIKLLTGELEPDEGSGEVWKHPNCRVGYIAQHAFHHIENHLEKTANEYIRWRYQGGGDREEAVKVTSIASEEDLKKMATAFPIPIEIEGIVFKAKNVVDRFTERRRENKKKGNMTEYECELVGKEGGVWIAMDLLLENGFKTVITKVDERIAIRAASFQRPLTKENVSKMFADVGLAPEFSTHMRMQALSGGQKVKIVLGAALWNCPHILILDEPTNYLDRESLGALARAIRKFDGGVVMITHNSQFCDNLCPVVWHLQNNTLDVKGDAEWMAEAGKQVIEVAEIPDECVDRFGNVVELKKKKKLSNRQRKEKKKRRQSRIKEGYGDYDSDEEL